MRQRGGFAIRHQTGSHAILRHSADASRRVTVPIHGRDLKTGTLRNIVREAGLTVDEFVRLL